MLNNIARSQRRFLRKCALVIAMSLFLTLVIYSSFDKIINRLNYYFTLCNEYTSNLLLSSGFTINKVVITGNKFTDKKDILDLIDRTQLIMHVSLSKLSSNVKPISKWIKDVRIHRVLPNTLHINIDEHKPFAIWKDNDKASIIDSEGKIIIDNYSTTNSRVISAHDAGIHDGSQDRSTGMKEEMDLINTLVVILGQNSLSNLKFVKDILESKTQLSEQVSLFVFVGNRRWNVILDSGLTVKLPEDNPHSAWDYLNRLQNITDFSLNDWSIIDMRITDKIFVKR
ncbi:MAG: FtsQ-type POTRA domain-containing protein [Wolbachia sp.]|nr:FtsQ-type POTRA domain-containing protein [Wolbachia sp.]MDD9335835.1 FtsQ-type POTRA domain-containing protein [Wolbachia sp.]